MRTWNIDQNLAHEFVKECRLAAAHDDLFDTFRRGPAMMTVVENNGPQWMQPQIDHAVKFIGVERASHIIAKLGALDCVGFAERVEGKLGGYRFYMSGTTARYVKMIAVLEWMFGSLSNAEIVEIGGGYGGLCAAIHLIWKPQSYIIYDLPEVIALQKKYLGKVIGDNFPIVYASDPSTAVFDRGYDLSIALCSLSELPRPMQHVYFDKVVRHARAGFMIWNSGFTEGDDIIQHHEATAYLNNELGFEGEWLTRHCEADEIHYNEGTFTYVWGKEAASG